jgi:hypothetical protein
MAKIEIEESDLRELNAGLKTLMDQAEQDRQEIAYIKNDLLVMYKSCAGILGVVGLSDGKKIDPATFSQDGIYTKIAKGGGSLITLMMQSRVPGIGVSAKKEIDEKFSFLQHMVPVLNKWNPVFQDLELPEYEEIIQQYLQAEEPLKFDAPSEPLQLDAPAEPLKLNEP